MPIVTVTKTGEVDGTEFAYEARSVVGDVSLPDFVKMFQDEDFSMTFVPVKKGRAKEGEEKEEKGALNFILEAYNLYLYRNALALNKPAEDPRDKSIRRMISLISDKETVLRAISALYPNEDANEHFARLKPVKK